MSKIVVAKLVRLGQDGNSFKKDLIAKTMRTNAKVDDEYLKEFNASWKTRGQLYIIDEDATRVRNEALEPPKPTQKGRPKKTE